jgi:hypothetical protein
MPKDEADKPSLDQIKGRNPHFFDDPNIDRLLTMDTHERLAALHGIYAEKDVEGYRPSEEEAKVRQEWRSRFLDRILKALYTKYDSGPASKS